MLVFFWFQPRNGWPWWVTYSEIARLGVQRNVAGQKVTLLAINTSTNQPITGDAANLTAYVSKDDGAVTVLGDTSAAELDATNAPGLYSFDLTQGETDANKLVFSGKSSTANVRLVPQILQTVPANFALASIDSAGAIASTGKDVLVSTTIATLASQLQFTLTEGSTDDKAYNGCRVIVRDQSTNVQKATAVCLQYTGSTKTMRLAFDPGVFTMAAGDYVEVIADAIHPEIMCALSVTSSIGSSAELMVWMEVQNRIVPVASLDASASCSVVVSEHDSGVTHFTAAGVASDLQGPRFEYVQPTPAFQDDTQYSATASITLNSQTFSTTHNNIVVG